MDLASRIPHGVTDATHLKMIQGAPTANVWASRPVDPDALRLCPTCHEKLPDGAHPTRVYCSDRCRFHMRDVKGRGKPTLWVTKCGRCGEWFESYHRGAKWCSNRCRMFRKRE